MGEIPRVTTVKPPERPAETASVWIQLRVRPSDKRRWMDLAASEGVSLTKWIVKRLEGKS